MIQKLHVAALAGMVAISATGSSQTGSFSTPKNFPMNLWSEQKKVTQIPLKLVLDAPRLRADFRQELSVRVEIKQTDLEKFGISSNLVMFMRVLDGSTAITGIVSGGPYELVAPIPRASSDLQQPGFRTVGKVWSRPAIARPGKYKLELAILDRLSGRHSTLYEDISVPGNANEPLEKALRGLPLFEFGGTAPVLQIVKPVTVASTSKQLPSIPVDGTGTLHLSVLTILSPPDPALNSELYLNSFRENLTGFLATFLRLDVPLGTARLTAVDLINRRIVFDRKNMKELQLEKLKTEIKKDANTVSLDALVGAGERGRFFRDALRAQFEAAENDIEGAQHVIVIVAPRTEMPGVSNLQPLTPERNCHCRVIYFRVAAKGRADDIDDLLKAYQPQVFEPMDWPEFRKDFGTIYQQLIR